MPGDTPGLTGVNERAQQGIPEKELGYVVEGGGGHHVKAGCEVFVEFIWERRVINRTAAPKQKSDVPCAQGGNDVGSIQRTKRHPLRIHPMATEYGRNTGREGFCEEDGPNAFGETLGFADEFEVFLKALPSLQTAGIHDDEIVLVESKAGTPRASMIHILIEARIFIVGARHLEDGQRRIPLQSFSVQQRRNHEGTSARKQHLVFLVSKYGAACPVPEISSRGGGLVDL